MADAPGTCHLVGCPGKGTVDEHARQPIGAPDTAVAYDADRCLGTPVARSTDHGLLTVVCSIDNGAWNVGPFDRIHAVGMAQLVDQHRTDCPNRDVRVPLNIGGRRG